MLVKHIRELVEHLQSFLPTQHPINYDDGLKRLSEAGMSQLFDCYHNREEFLASLQFGESDRIDYYFDFAAFACIAGVMKDRERENYETIKSAPNHSILIFHLLSADGGVSYVLELQGEPLALEDPAARAIEPYVWGSGEVEKTAGTRLLHPHPGYLDVRCDAQIYDQVKWHLEATGTKKDVREAKSQRLSSQDHLDRIFFFAHGTFTDGQPMVRLPKNHQIRFYANRGKVIDIHQTASLAYLVARGERIDFPHECVVPNYKFAANSDEDIQYYVSIFEKEIDEGRCHLLGYNLNRSPMYLCSTPESRDCAEGAHGCDGLLGMFRGVPLDIDSCRTQSGAKKFNSTVRNVSTQVESAFGFDILPEKIRLLGQDRASGRTFNGEFAEWFDGLDTSLAALACTNGKVRRWVSSRRYWTASEEGTNAAALGRLFASPQADLRPSDMDGLDKRDLGFDSTFIAEVKGSYLFRTDKISFAVFFKNLPSGVKESLIRHDARIARWDKFASDTEFEIIREKLADEFKGNPKGFAELWGRLSVEARSALGDYVQFSDITQQYERAFSLFSRNRFAFSKEWLRCSLEVVEMLRINPEIRKWEAGMR